MAMNREHEPNAAVADSDEHPVEINVSIQELIVHGVSDAVVRQGLERTFQQELGRLLSAQQLQGGQILNVRRPLELKLTRGDGAQQFGHKLAHTVHGALPK